MDYQDACDCTSEYHAFTPAEITREYLRNLIKSAESTLGYGIENIAIVLPDGQNLRTIPKEVINHKIKGNYTRYDTSGQNLTGNEIYLRRMKHEVENAKRLLSTQEWVQIDVRHPESGGHDLSEKLTRSKFEDLSMDLVRKTLALIDQVIKDSAVFTKDDIQDVVFSGGSTNIPFIQSSIKQYFVIRLFAYISSTKPRVFLDEFELTGIAPAPKGVPQIRVRISLYSCDFYAN
ncbi:ATPase with role in protein import into the ER, partial [Gryganskiella cystojenkinii]